MDRIVPKDAILIPDHAKQVFSGVLFDVYQWQQELFDGTTTTYEMLRRPDTVIILAIQDDKIVMVEEQQSGRPSYLRFPGGRVEPGEAWQQAAEREMLEETGLRFNQWRLVDVEQVESKIEWFVAVFLAYDVAGQSEQRQDAGEKVTVLLKTLDEVRQTTRVDGNLLLKHSKPFFDKINSLDQLKNLPPFQGREL